MHLDLFKLDQNRCVKAQRAGGVEVKHHNIGQSTAGRQCPTPQKARVMIEKSKNHNVPVNTKEIMARE